MHDGANALVEIDGWFVPLEHAPVQPTSVHRDHFLGELNQQLFAVPLLALALPDVQVLEVDARLGAPGAVVVEIQSDPGFNALWCSQNEASGRLCRGYGLGCGRGGFARGSERNGGKELFLGGLDAVKFLLVVGQLPNELKDRGDIWALEDGWSVGFQPVYVTNGKAGGANKPSRVARRTVAEDILYKTV